MPNMIGVWIHFEVIIIREHSIITSAHFWRFRTPNHGSMKYGRLAEFLPGKPDFHRKFGLFWQILANNYQESSVRLTKKISFSQKNFISCFALPGSRKNYSALYILLLGTVREVKVVQSCMLSTMTLDLKDVNSNTIYSKLQ